MTNSILRVSGQVNQPGEFTFAQLTELDDEFQIPDVSKIDAARNGSAIRLSGILQAVDVRDEAKFIGLHSSHDDFHASIPLADVQQQAIVIYQLDNAPLPREKGGPVRFYIPDHAACKTDEIDECANVKFVDHIELTSEKGFDNRPDDETEHAALHEKS